MITLERQNFPRIWHSKRMRLLVGYPNFCGSIGFKPHRVSPANKGRSKEEQGNGVDGDMPADSRAFSRLLQQFINRKAIGNGKQVHARIITSGLGSFVILENNLANMYAKCEEIRDARKVFDKMSERNVVSWTTLIAGYAQNGNPREALNLFWLMKRAGMQPNQFTFSSVLPACATLEVIEQGKQVHSEICKCEHESDIFVESALVDMYAKCGSVEDARQVFDKMTERNLVSWNAMIVGYAQNEHKEEALKLFSRASCEGIQPDQVTFSSVLSACASLAALGKGKQIHARIIKAKSDSEVCVVNALIDMYAKCGSIGDAQRVFDGAPLRDAVSWNVMIVGHAQNAHFEAVFNIFRDMQHNDIMLDEIAFSSILSACASLAALQQGKLIHTHIVKAEFQSNMCVGNALVDMYAKCGNIDDALLVFHRMPRRNVVSWTAMMTGCAQHGRGKQVIELFEQMNLSGMKLDYITFVCVLSACSHAGLVDEGRRYFDSMSHDHGITPSAEHYACMVDLLGRAGRMDEAEEFINAMPFEPNASIWGALLGACRIHDNMELGKRAAECLFKLEPQNSGNYMLLSNIYATTGKWDDALKVRKMMKDNRVRKEPGCSWIEVKNTVHAFIAADRSHPQTEQIYSMLEQLSWKMKDAGYVPDALCSV